MENIILYVANVNKLYESENFNQAYKILTQQRQKKVDEYKLLKDKVLSLAAGLLLQNALNSKGISLDNCKYSYTQYGKPCIKISDKNIHFNLSHSGEYAICAISDEEVGCDIEKVDKANLKIAKRFFAKDEYKILELIRDENLQNETFYRLWTLKESFLKTLGSGLRIPLNKFQILLKNEVSIIQNIDNNNYYFTEYNNIPDYKCSVCSKNIDYDVQITNVILQ